MFHFEASDWWLRGRPQVVPGWSRKPIIIGGTNSLMEGKDLETVTDDGDRFCEDSSLGEKMSFPYVINNK